MVERYVLGGPPDPATIFNLVKDLKRIQAEVEAEAVAVSIRQNHQLMEQVRAFVDRVVIEPTPKLPCHLLTYPENQGFRGRKETLDRISDSLKPSQQTLKSYALYGLGGVGKTQLALKFAYSNLDVFRAIFWIPAQTTGKLTQGLFDAAEQLGLVDTSAIIDEDKGVKDFMSWLRSCDVDWLMVFDNADDIKVLAPYWPSAKHGSILVTSRDPAILQRTRHGERVDSMDVDDAKDMFFGAIEPHLQRTEDSERLSEGILNDLGKSMTVVHQTWHR